MEWITDRQPTEADADSDGDVHVRSRPTSNGYSYIHYSYVGYGVPWRHSDWWNGNSDTEPTPTTDPTPTRVPRLFAQPVAPTWEMKRDGWHLSAIADDGTCWLLEPGWTEWQQVTPLPDREVPTYG